MQNYEYESLITQLGTTSEVTQIGFKITGVAGDIIEILSIHVLSSDLAAAKAFTMNLYQ